MLTFRDQSKIIPALRDGAPTIGALTDMVMTGAGNYFTEPIDVATFVELIGFINNKAVSGTNPTLDVNLQYSHNGKNWADSGDAFSQVTTTLGVTFKKFSANFGKWVRLKIAIGGTNNPSFTLTVNLHAKA